MSIQAYRTGVGLVLVAAVVMGGCGGGSQNSSSSTTSFALSDRSAVLAIVNRFAFNLNIGTSGAACDDLSTAARARYDQQGKAIGRSCTDLLAGKRIPGIPQSVTVTGDQADVSMSSGGPALRLVRENGTWKIDQFG
jgi:hypothetical protein